MKNAKNIVFYSLNQFFFVSLRQITKKQSVTQKKNERIL